MCDCNSGSESIVIGGVGGVSQPAIGVGGSDVEDVSEGVPTTA